jgi:hypothetical protein
VVELLEATLVVALPLQAAGIAPNIDSIVLVTSTEVRPDSTMALMIL